MNFVSEIFYLTHTNPQIHLLTHKVLKLEAIPMREPGKYSTHSLKLNTYVKDAAAPASAPQPDKRNEYIHDAVVTPQVVGDRGLPF
jgi:hypothetical protein